MKNLENFEIFLKGYCIKTISEALADVMKDLEFGMNLYRFSIESFDD